MALVNGKGENITGADLLQAASFVNIPQNFVVEAMQRKGEALAGLETLKAKVR